MAIVNNRRLKLSPIVSKAKESLTVLELSPVKSEFKYGLRISTSYVLIKYDICSTVVSLIGLVEMLLV